MAWNIRVVWEMGVYYTFCTEDCLRDIDARAVTIKHCEIYSTYSSKGRWDNIENTCRTFAAGKNVVWRGGPIDGPIGRYVK